MSAVKRCSCARACVCVSVWGGGRSRGFVEIDEVAEMGFEVTEVMLTKRAGAPRLSHVRMHALYGSGHGVGGTAAIRWGFVGMGRGCDVGGNMAHRC